MLKLGSYPRMLAALVVMLFFAAVELDPAAAYPESSSGLLVSPGQAGIAAAVGPVLSEPGSPTVSAAGIDTAAIPEAVADNTGVVATPESREWSDEWRQGPPPPSSAVIPMLMYHHVAQIDRSRVNALESDLTVLPTEFEKQLSHLRSQGYASVSMREVWNYLQGGKPLPPKPVVLTFDDGYDDNYRNAYPLLMRYGLRGTFFIISGMAGQPRYMTMGQVQELFRSGMEIGAHSSSHPSLSGLPASRLTQELVWPKRHLEEVTGAPVLALSYPNGAYDQSVIEAARNAGYRMAVTTRYGAAHLRDRLMEMVRVRINGAVSIATFRWQLERY